MEEEAAAPVWENNRVVPRGVVPKAKATDGEALRLLAQAATKVPKAALAEGNRIPIL